MEEFFSVGIFIVYLLYRAYSAVQSGKKEAEERAKENRKRRPHTGEQNPSEPVQPPAKTFEEILAEMMGETIEDKPVPKPTPKTAPIPKPKPAAVQSKKVLPPKKEVAVAYDFDALDSIPPQEGMSAMSKRSGTPVSMKAIEREEEEDPYDFDPREAFMIKLLLERKYGSPLR